MKMKYFSVSLCLSILNYMRRDTNTRDRNVDFARCDSCRSRDHFHGFPRDKDFTSCRHVLSHFGSAVDGVAETIFMANDKDFPIINSTGDVYVKIV